MSLELIDRFMAAPDGLSLDDLTAEEERDLPYSIKLDLRATAYRARVGTMVVPPQLASWAKTMAKRYGPEVRIHQNTLPWLEALMVARYGEEPAHWPAAFSADDVTRAIAWMRKGRQPRGVMYLDLEADGFVRVRVLLAMLSIWVGAHLAQLLAGLLGLAAIVSAGVFGRMDLSLPLAFGSALSNFWENELIDHLFRGRSYSSPSDLYIALYTAAPGETGGGTEVSGNNYSRVQVAAAYDEWEGTGGETSDTDSTGTGGATQNVNAITFPVPSGNWGTISHFAAMSASSSGSVFFYGALAASKTVNNGDPAPAFAAGALDFSLA